MPRRQRLPPGGQANFYIDNCSELLSLQPFRATGAPSLRKAIDDADDAGDADTADIFTAFSRALDKALWFLEAHTQE